MNYPFLEPAFLDALAASNSVGRGTGWEPLPIELRDHGQRLALMPLYLKSHSWGEYVFDWAWADAYDRHGLDYYPKLVTAIPFSPATGPRVVYGAGVDRRALARQLVAEVHRLAGEVSASGWHLLFPDAPTLDDFTGPDLMQRSGVQFHWFNRGYQDFDDFLERFVARKRKMVRRERRRIGEQGLRVEMLVGEDIGAPLWDFFFRLYQRTYLKRSGNRGYLTRDFFGRVGAAMPAQIAMAVAYDGADIVACALYFSDANTLYGRYWGAAREYDCLHFELCYYQGIDYAIRLGLQKFDAGAQGEHKILRGFEPVETHSLHWIRRAEFAAAIAQFIRREKNDNAAYMAQARSLLPYRGGAADA